MSSDPPSKIDAYWRAANYLSVGQIYLLANPLLREPLRFEHVKPRLLGHWGTTPGLNFVYVARQPRHQRARPRRHLRRRPRPRRPGVVANAYLEGTYSEVYPDVSQDARGMQHALPAVLLPRRHPQPRRARDARQHPRGRRARLRAQPRVRRGVRQPGPARLLRRRRRRGRDRAARDELALQQVPQPGQRRRGAAHPAPQRLQDRRPHGARAHPARGARAAAARLRLGAALRRGRRPARRCTAQMAAALDDASPRSRASRPRRARADSRRRPRWPMIVLRTPKGWTGPKEVDGMPVEGTFRAHQVPFDVGARARAPRAARGVDEELPARGLFDDARAPRRRSSPSCRRRATAA